jgi:hypothetical protein
MTRLRTLVARSACFGEPAVNHVVVETNGDEIGRAAVSRFAVQRFLEFAQEAGPLERTLRTDEDHAVMLVDATVHHAVDLLANRRVVLEEEGGDAGFFERTVELMRERFVGAGRRR